MPRMMTVLEMLSVQWKRSATAQNLTKDLIVKVSSIFNFKRPHFQIFILHSVLYIPPPCFITTPLPHSFELTDEYELLSV